MSKLFKNILVTCIAFFALSACKKNKSSDPDPTKPIEVGGGDEENITRLVLFLNNGIEKDTISYKTIGGISVDSLLLLTNTTYSIEIKVYDDSKTPAVIVSDEIQKEANFHRFHFTFTPTIGTPSLTTSITDQDTKLPPQPLGLKFNLATGTNNGKGIFKINLRHFASGLEKTSDPVGGDSDILIEFPVRIK
jgi:PKD repeat protein